MKKIVDLILKLQIVGILFGFGLNQMFFKSNKKEEALIEIKKDLVISNYEYLRNL